MQTSGPPSAGRSLSVSGLCRGNGGRTCERPAVAGRSVLLGGGALARYVRRGSIGRNPQRTLKAAEEIAQARGRRCTRSIQASRWGNEPAIGRCSWSTPVERVAIVGGRREHAVLQERERADVGGAELLAHQVVAAVEQVLEPGEPVAQCSAWSWMTCASGSGRASSAAIALGATFQTRLNHSTNTSTSRVRGAVRGPQRRVGPALLDPVDDPHRVDDDLAVVGDQHRHELLAAGLDDGRAVVGGHVDPVDGDRLVGQGEGHALDVGRVGDAEDPRHGAGS